MRLLAPNELDPRTSTLDRGILNFSKPAVTYPIVLHRCEKVGVVKVFISGNFNVVHPGHIRLFKKARELGSTLVIGVVSSSISPGAKLFPDSERLDAVSRNSLVNEVVLIDKPLLNVLELVNPDFKALPPEKKLEKIQFIREDALRSVQQAINQQPPYFIQKNK